MVVGSAILYHRYPNVIEVSIVRAPSLIFLSLGRVAKYAERIFLISTSVSITGTRRRRIPNPTLLLTQSTVFDVCRGT